MTKTVFPLRLESQLKEAIRDRAKLENRSQNDLISSVMQSHIIENPYKGKTASETSEERLLAKDVS